MIISFLDFIQGDDILEESFINTNGMSSEAFENVIAYGYNRKHNKNSVSRNDKAANWYNKNKELVLRIVDVIDKKLNGKDYSPLYKLSNDLPIKASALAQYLTFKLNMSANGLKVPKTDIISKDKKLKISLKEHEDSQLTSGGGPETLLLFNAAIALTARKKEDLKFAKLKKLLSMTKNWNSTKKNDEVVSNFSGKYVKDIQDEIQRLVEADDKFKRKLIELAITGSFKFDDGADAIPTHILQWSIKKSDAILMFDINEYIEHILNDRTVLFLFRPKTGATTRYLIFSIKVR